MNAALYRAYLKHQAVNHPDLQHTDAEGGMVFAMMHVEEALSDLRTSAKEKAFLMRGFHYTYALDDDGEGRKRLQGGFMVAKYYSATEAGTTAMLAAMDDAERVVDEIVEKMISDSRAGHPLFFHSLDSGQRIDVRPRPLMSDSYAGWLCLFDFYQDYRVCLTHEDAPAWIDGGQTPFEL